MCSVLLCECILLRTTYLVLRRRGRQHKSANFTVGKIAYLRNEALHRRRIGNCGLFAGLYACNSCSCNLASWRTYLNEFVSRDSSEVSPGRYQHD